MCPGCVGVGTHKMIVNTNGELTLCPNEVRQPCSSTRGHPSRVNSCDQRMIVNDNPAPLFERPSITRVSSCDHSTMCVLCGVGGMGLCIGRIVCECECKGFSSPFHPS